MARLLYFDCNAGIAGDMTLAALIDLGVPLELVRMGITSLGLPEVAVEVTEVKRKGFRAKHLGISHPPEHAHRHLSDIERMIDGSDQVESSAKNLAKKIFHEIGVAEAHVHGTTLEKVHFHEVGAIDSIVDIVGVAIALDHLKIDHAIASPIPTGSGEIEIAHGRVRVPAPATLEILRGIPLADCPVDAELTTPTGAAIVKATCQRFGHLPHMVVENIGYGAGTRDLEDRANVLRLVLGQTEWTTTDAESGSSMQGAIETDSVAVVETNLDDASPQTIAYAAQALWAAGVKDVWQTPCAMKKGRLGTVLSVLCRHEDRDAVSKILMRQTPAIGVRSYVVQRSMLPRETVAETTPWGEVPCKRVQVNESESRQWPEDDEVRRVAQREGVSSMHVRHTATRFTD